MSKERYAPVKLILKPTAEQQADLENLFVEFDRLCKWLQAEAPAELKEFRSVYAWTYPKLREQQVYSQMIKKVAGKVSSHRVREKPLETTFILYDSQMFTFLRGKLNLRLSTGREIVDYDISAGENTRRQLLLCTPQSGVLRKGDKDFLFELRVFPPQKLTYVGGR